MYDYTRHCGRKGFVFIVYRHLEQQKHCSVILRTVLKLMVKKWLKRQKRNEYVRFKNYERKTSTQLWSMQILKAFYCLKIMGSKIQMSLSWTNIKNILLAVMFCSYKLVCVDDKFRKPFKSYLGKDAVYSFNNSMVKESKYCSHVINKKLTKNL